MVIVVLAVELVARLSEIQLFLCVVFWIDMNAVLIALFLDGRIWRCARYVFLLMNIESVLGEC